MVATKRDRRIKEIIPRIPELFTYYVTATSRNTKTGNIPTVWIAGDSGDPDTDKQETAASCACSGCPLLPKHKGGEGVPEDRLPCYAWQGQVSIALGTIIKAAKRKGRKHYSLWNALKNSASSARYVRMTAIGDPSALNRRQKEEMTDTIQQYNEQYCGPKNQYRLIGYIHGWRLAPWWKDRLMASCDTLEEADKAIAKGWRPAVTVPSGTKGKSVKTPAGNTLLICPHLTEDAKEKRVPDCNDCGWCSVERTEYRQFGIAFPSHR